ncbi:MULTISPECIES: 1-aminocyclopropane-1-carboxylate deaminase/D-cysteine desulfhydrase [Nostoc]|uniref:1-aminocyclopropane-1-carboxylate deaminase/D-cysteine desulfhydrase n=1 Tax=Nostoc paludosum FACHB-159 TaxID=2692908 RepID=A0ABR8KBE1_9NOSO|nr:MULTISPECIES: pyridoxal-phosphate dependent enzyme [Nostoc]MBD2680102.1 1-aminocyclopropane-1-carboxylate deaminase/D-cysteine desulfhydrase [Nostoc sp. FACHB-857]MBD2736360.1 1-aminocyclopropane-1-carboxylate deaminase/D-cysteine desulfhydrase [Nostoc paludosum FACHB-159]
MSLIFIPPFIEQINSEIAREAGVNLSVLRLDVMHPSVNGNKWFKLKYNLLEAKQKNFTRLLTFGGAYSNHIYATAAAGNLLGFDTIGVIRGEEKLPLNPTLSFAVQQGMELVYVSREMYRERNTAALHEHLRQRFGEVFIIPEGGNNLNGVRGCTEIISEAMPTVVTELLALSDAEGCRSAGYAFDYICLACGTATTLAGIALSLHQGQKAIAFPVLKNGAFLREEIENLLTNYLASGVPTPYSSPACWELMCDYHFGGYAKVNQELLRFSQEFGEAHGVPLDYVYTAKMFYGVMDLLQQGFFSKGKSLLLVHTGGLQGNVGMEERLQKISQM